jgi:tetraacyldisaccharide 4'-kinase
MPVISVGNITVGGTGKTPHVEYLVQLLKNDYKLAVLSRGYKRKTNHFILASKKTSVSDVGDEPLQIKLKFPDINVAVERNRVKGVRELTKRFRKLEMVILDDAFQHRYVHPCLSILLVNYNRPVFKDVLLPAGNLREPWRNARRADIIIVTKCPDYLSFTQREDFIKNLHLRSKQEIFFTKYKYGTPIPVFPDKHNRHEGLTYRHLNKAQTSIMLVTGIADPEPLKLFLQGIVPVTEEITFPDHHNYKRKDMQLIMDTFGTIKAEEKIILVTEKDAVRIRETSFSDKSFKRAFYYIPVEVKFLAKGEKPFIKRTYKILRKPGGK